MKSQTNSRIIWYAVGGLVLLVIAWIATSSNDTPTVAKKKLTTPKVASSGEDQFTDQDYSAHFASVALPASKDAFKPLVYRKDVAARNGAAQLNAIPSDFAGGDANWLYTGTAAVDGVPEALFENKSTGEGVFVQHGAHWKNATVQEITPTTVLLDGPSGTKLLQLVSEEPVAAATTTPGATPAAGANGTAPVTPPVNGALTGPIDNSTVTPTADASTTGGGGGRRRRRGGGG